MQTFLGQQKVNDWMTLKGKLFYHNHKDVGDFYYDPALTQEIARSTYKDNTTGGNILDEISLSSNDTLRASFLYRRDDHQQTALTYLPFQEATSYTGSFGVEDQFDPIKPLSIVAGAAYDFWDVTGSTQTQTKLIGGFHRLHPPQDPECRQGRPHGRRRLYLWLTKPSSSPPGRRRSGSPP